MDSREALRRRTSTELDLGFFLRTGRARARQVEVKFNPNHDPRNGQFTFAGGGGSTGGGGATGSWDKPDNPRTLAHHNPPTPVNRDRSKPADRRHVVAPVDGSTDGWRKVSANGYDFEIDREARTRLIDGNLTGGITTTRSRRYQSQAGGAHRQSGDDGGHYIALRFNGPRESFNHFAQDASFNRGAYRLLEDGWASELRAKHLVHVSIEPHYTGPSQRPDRLDVTWYVDGKRHHREFQNRRGGR